MEGLLKIVLKFGLGLSGVAAISFFMLMKQWLSIPALESLSEDQIFYCLILSLVSITVFFVILLAKNNSNHGIISTSSGSGHAVVTTGKNSPVDIGK